MSPTALLAPVTGVLIPLDTVPDQAFALKMVGDGVSIDPLESIVVAPCDGQVAFLHPAHHALTIATDDGAEVLIHVGLDTVNLKGRGFEVLVAQGDRVSAGQELLRFDLDTLIDGATSLLTQMVISNTDAVAELLPAEGIVTAGMDVALRYRMNGSSPRRAVGDGGPTVTSDPIVVPNPSGLHARPAANLAGLAKAYLSEVHVLKGEAIANAKSITSIMTLEVGRGDEIRIRATGRDAEQAVALIVERIKEGLGEEVEGGLVTTPSSVTPAPVGEPRRSEPPADPNLITGVAASPGVALGTVVQMAERDIEVGEDPQGTHAEETAALEAAVARARADLADLERSLASTAGTDKAAIFAAHRELLEDPELEEATRAGLRRGESAGYAWKQAYQAQAAMLEKLGNPLLAERATDIRDVGLRVLEQLTGQTVDAPALPPQAVVIATDLTASDTALLDASRVVGFVTVKGGATSHSAILAQSMGIPAIAGAEARVLDVPDGARVVLDGTAGTLQLNLSEAEMIAVRERQQEVVRRRRLNRESAHHPARTIDGIDVEVVANAGSVADAIAAVEAGAEGIGLLRSEFVFMDRQSAPDEEEQAALYLAVSRALGAGRRLVIRTLDVGGDKPLPYLPLPPEENPFLGQRGIRVGLDQQQFLRPQLRAILRAGAEGPADMHVMFPMVSTLEEFRAVKDMMEQERADLGLPPVALGIMVEVPAVAVMADQFAREVDFFSIGTNDLTQYTLAMDRGHSRLATSCDALNPGVLGLIASTVEAAHAHGKWVGVCGALASREDVVPLLVGMGVDELSAVVPAVPDIRAAVRTMTRTECRSLAQKALASTTAAEVHGLLATPTTH